MLNWEPMAVPEDDRVAAWGGWPMNCPELPPRQPPSPQVVLLTTCPVPAAPGW